MEAPDTKKLIHIMLTDYLKDKLSMAAWNKLSKHLSIIGKGEIIELPVYTAEEKIFYSGPKGILRFLKKQCAFEVFFDYGFYDNGKKEVDVDFYLDKGKLWVNIPGDSVMFPFNDWIQFIDNQ
jgi:hypothetical protein